MKQETLFVYTNKDGYPIHESEEVKFRRMNKIVGINARMDLLLVDTKNNYDLCPAGYELPANRLIRKDRKIIVAFGDQNIKIFQHTESIKTIKFYPANGVIVPRNTDIVNDVAAGYRHTYVVLDSHAIPQKVLDDLKRESEEEIRKMNEWLPDIF